MALVRCFECQKDISDSSLVCPNCGARQSQPKKTKWWLWVPVGLVVAFVALGAVQSGSPEAKERAVGRAAIDLCWSNQAKKSNGAGAAQFIAGACEQLEAKFKAKWGVNP